MRLIFASIIIVFGVSVAESMEAGDDVTHNIMIRRGYEFSHILGEPEIESFTIRNFISTTLKLLQPPWQSRRKLWPTTRTLNLTAGSGTTHFGSSQLLRRETYLRNFAQAV